MTDETKRTVPELQASSACPKCGVETPHHHGSEDTPRTDAIFVNGLAYPHYQIVEGQKLCRQLERELAEAQHHVGALLQRAEAAESTRSARPEWGPATEDTVAWLVIRHGGTFHPKREVVPTPLTDDVYMDEGDEAFPLVIRSTIGARCRSDDRCQYAIDHGAEGMGHCPPGKCAWPDYESRYENERNAGATHDQAHHAATGQTKNEIR